MADPIKVAQSRRDSYKKDIETKEAEIEELKELISDLDSFIEFGEALINEGGEDKPVDGKSTPKVVSKPAPEVTATSTPQQPRAIKSRPTADDEWGSDDDSNGIARVLAARNG